MTGHLRERFFQRYGHELTEDVLRELRYAAAKLPPGEPDKIPGREKVTVRWNGQAIRMVWNRERRFVFTFLPPEDRGQRISVPLLRGRRKRR